MDAILPNIVLPLVMLAAFALIIGAVYFWRRTGEVKQPALMVFLALVMFVNVLIWTIPDSSGGALVDKVDQIETSE